MKLLPLMLTLLSLVSCIKEKPTVEKTKTVFYYLVSSRYGLKEDTLTYKEINVLDKEDELLAQDYFSYNKKEYGIKMYSSDNHAPVDGGSLYYTLDSIGIIYSRSTTWPSSVRLQSNNDSINNLLHAAYAYIMLKPSLHCYQCREMETREVKFVPPVIKEE